MNITTDLTRSQRDAVFISELLFTAVQRLETYGPEVLGMVREYVQQWRQPVEPSADIILMMLNTIEATHYGSRAEA